MNDNDLVVRLIEPGDNEELAQLIRSVLDEFRVPKIGTAYADKELDIMYESFTIPGARYFILEERGMLIGGAGIIGLKGEAADICELQKMYLTDRARGRGLGSRLLEICLQAARDMGYTSCYLETMTAMKTAQKLYVKAGFKYLDERMGATGHYLCPIWMLKELKS